MFKPFSKILFIAAAIAALSTQASATVVYASNVVSANSTGLTLSNTAISADRLVATSSLGRPADATSSSTGFYSLGFGGSLTLQFSGLIGAGTATFFETTGAGPYPVESASIYLFDLASSSYVLAGSVDNIGNDTLSLAGFCAIGCSNLKIVDTSKQSDFAGFANADGYDVNSVSVNLFAAQSRSNNVPEPSSLALFSLAILGLAISRRRR